MEYLIKHLDHTDPRIKKIAIHYGYDVESIKLVEEMSELTKAICKHRESKDKVKTLIEIKEEMVDVYIVLEHLKYLLNISEKELEEKKEFKINRQLIRIKAEE